jgi:hypothetical protein
MMQAEFKVNVKTYWNSSGEYELLDTSIDEGVDMNDDGEEEEEQESQQGKK